MSQFGNSHSVCVLHHKCVMLMNYFFERENDRLSSSTDDQTLLNEIPSPPQWMFNTILPLTSHVLSLSLFRKHIITLDPPSLPFIHSNDPSSKSSHLPLPPPPPCCFFSFLSVRTISCVVEAGCWGIQRNNVVGEINPIISKHTPNK